MIIQVCIGSSCHLKGSHKIAELMKKAVEEHGLDREITLTGAFCIGKCGGTGVTVQIDDDVVCGVSEDNFDEIFEKYVLSVLKNQA